MFLSKTTKIVYFILGSLSLIMSYIGVALPGIPGIPFILLTAYFYVRSSERMYRWLLKNAIFGNLLRRFHQQKTVSKGFKVLVISQLWVSITVAQIWFLSSIYIRIVVFISGIFFSILIWKIKSNRQKNMEI
jgi:uncharacterized membrane protein YbaN (DUF454 family)